jgi:hypothetical protein
MIGYVFIGKQGRIRGGLASQDWNGAMDEVMEGIIVHAMMQ